MMHKKMQPIKLNGKPQRSDTILTKEVASALVHLVHLGKTLYPKGGKIALYIHDGYGGETPIILPITTLNSWIKRRNVLPDGRTLRDVLNEAREEYRTRKYEERRDTLLDEAEQVLDKTLAIKTKEPIISRSGVIINNEKTGKPLMRENPKLLGEQMKAARFALERLYPERYGKIRKREHKTPSFSLQDLSRCKEKVGEKHDQVNGIEQEDDNGDKISTHGVVRSEHEVLPQKESVPESNPLKDWKPETMSKEEVQRLRAILAEA